MNDTRWRSQVINFKARTFKASVSSRTIEEELNLLGAQDWESITAQSIPADPNLHIAADGDPRFTMKQFPRLNHRLIADNGPLLPAESGYPGHVDPVVIADIGTWIAAH